MYFVNYITWEIGIIQISIFCQPNDCRKGTWPLFTLMFLVEVKNSNKMRLLHTILILIDVQTIFRKYLILNYVVIITQPYIKKTNKTSTARKCGAISYVAGHVRSVSMLIKDRGTCASTYVARSDATQRTSLQRILSYKGQVRKIFRNHSCHLGMNVLRNNHRHWSMCQ